MKRLVKVTINAVVEVDNPNEVKEVIDEIVQFDWDFDSYEWQDLGEVRE